MNKIHTGDKVIVTSGKWKGSTSTVSEIGKKKDERRGDWVVLKGINTMKKGKKGEGFVEFDAPIHSSNVMLRDEKSGSGSKVGIRTNKSGKKERYYKKSGEIVVK